MKKIILLFSSVALVPFVALAQTPDTGYFTGLLTDVESIINALPPIIIGIAVVVFLWGVVKFMLAGDNDDARASGKKTMIWGLVGLLVMVSIWGIIAFFQGVIGIGGKTRPDTVIDNL